MNKRNCKEISIKTKYDTFQVKYGTLNKLSPKSIYITGKSWITPIEKEYQDCITEIKNECRKIDRTVLSSSDIFQTKSIMNIELADKRLAEHKKSFFTFELFLLQKEERKLNDILLLNDIHSISNNIIEKITNLSEDTLKFSNKK